MVKMTKIAILLSAIGLVSNVWAAGAAQATDTTAAAAPTDPATIKQIADAVKKLEADNGFEMYGYMRAGFYGSSGDGMKGKYSLGGSTQYYRLGNEGDQYVELGFKKSFKLADGAKWSITYMPAVWCGSGAGNCSGNNGKVVTKQLYADITGLSFAPDLTFWAGQRYHRIQDIHMIDNWMMEDGDNFGAGVDGIALLSGKLNVAAYTDGTFGSDYPTTNNAKRVNLQWRDLAVNHDGKLTLTAAKGFGNFVHGKDGYALGLLHNQSNFLTEGLTNSFFAQMSDGHIAINGEFNNLGDTSTTPMVGTKHTRFTDSLNWQKGRFGGQTVLGYETVKDDNAETAKYVTAAARASYGLTKNVKLLGELGFNHKKQGDVSGNLNKETVALALSPNWDFWTRPEFRLYYTRINQSANIGKDANLFGVQIEAWW